MKQGLHVRSALRRRTKSCNERRADLVRKRGRIHKGERCTKCGHVTR